MPPVFKKLTDHTLFRYIFIGGLSFVIEIGAIYLLVGVFNLTSIVAVALSFWIGLITSFILQKFFAFRDRRVSVKYVARQSIAYGILIAVNYLFTLGFVALLEATMGIFVARTVALIITTAWNFIVYSKMIFKDRSV